MGSVIPDTDTTSMAADTLPRKAFGRLAQRLFEPVDIAALVYFRVVFAAFLLLEIWRYFDHRWIDRYFIEPTFFFSYPGLSWLQPWPGRWMYVHFLGLGVAALGILVGYRHRLCSVSFFLGYTYVLLLDQTNYLNHLYLISLLSLLLIFLPANRSLSYDSERDPGIRSDVAPAWCLWLLRAQIGIVYFYGGIAKLNADWLRGQPMRMWLANRADLPLIGPWLAEPWAAWAFSYGGLLLDLLVVPGLLWRRSRPIALLALVSFHLLNATLFRIGIFPWLMLALIPLFFPPDWMRLGARIPNRKESKAKAPYWSRDPGQNRVALTLLSLYAAVQVFMPLRHILYPGNVNWTEEGHRASWHMKLRDKSSSVRLFVEDPPTGRTWKIRLGDHLTSRQRKKMAIRPEMIRQFAHHVAEVFRARGVENPRVRATVMTSLNGRKPQPLIDPRADLASLPWSLRPATWIVPLRQPLVR